METTAGHGAAATVSAPTGREAITALIIDDERHVRAFLRTALRSLGVQQIHEATNGEDGVARFQEVQPALVLLDINMPVMRGDTTLQRILAFDPGATVVMVTTESQHETVRAFLDLGAVGYVLKHRPAEGVRAALAQLLDQFEVVAKP